MRQLFFKSRLLTVPLVLASCASMLGQNPQLRTKNASRFPTVVFTFVLWNANPPYYSIAIDSTGASTYQSAPNSVERTGVPYTIEFQANDATRRTTFSIARDLNFFRDDFPTSLGFPSKDPVESLTYHDSTFNHQITFTNSTDSRIQELVSVFDEISATLEFGRRLLYSHESAPNALDDELASMEKDSRRHLLRELQAVAPVLRSIAADNKLPSSTRQKAQTILATASQQNTTAGR